MNEQSHVTSVSHEQEIKYLMLHPDSNSYILCYFSKGKQ